LGEAIEEIEERVALVVEEAENKASL